MRKWILWIVVVSVMISVTTGFGIFGGGSGSIFGGIGTGGGSGYSSAKGVLDTSFNGTGIVVYHNAAGGNSSDYGNSIYVDSNGKIYVTGYSRNRSGNTDMVIWRYNSNGSLDNTFGNNGIVVHHNAAGGNSDDIGSLIYVDSEGKIYVTGYSRNRSGNDDMVIWRYNSNGSLDNTFGNNGIVVHHNAAGGNSDDIGSLIYVDSEGKIYVTGYSRNRSGNDDMVIWRYNSNGSLDNTFGNNGIVVHHNAAGGNSDDIGSLIYVDSEGKIYVTGYSRNRSGNDDMVIWRYNSNGSLDNTFGNNGIVVHHNAAGGNSDDIGSLIYVDSEGKIYVTGYSRNRSGNDDMVIWRYNSNGSLDNTFGNNGIVVHHNAAGGNYDDAGFSIYVDSEGKIYVTGYSRNRSGNTDMVIWRYNSNGSLDNTFGNNGIVVHHNAAGGNSDDIGISIYVDSEGKIYVTGFSRNRSGNIDMVIWRYK
jgi:uncharacterized delta-60 repeat protein